MYYFKQALFSIIYLIFMAVIAIGIIYIQIPWVSVLLGILNFLLYCTIMFLAYFKSGGQAYKVLMQNDLDRLEIIRTGENIRLKRMEEYKPYKGFLIGLFVCLPLIVFMLIHLILYFSLGPQYNGAGASGTIMYLVFYAVYQSFIKDIQVKSAYYFFTLLFVPIVSSVSGVAYILGAKKVKKQYDLAEQKKKEIYGEQ